jgi:hypothetical protein
VLLLTAKLLAAWPPTRRAGLLIEGRMSPGQTLANWRDYPLRSATEACSFAGITLGVYAARSLTLAVQAGHPIPLSSVLTLPLTHPRPYPNP